MDLDTERTATATRSTNPVGPAIQLPLGARCAADAAPPADHAGQRGGEDRRAVCGERIRWRSSLSQGSLWPAPSGRSLVVDVGHIPGEEAIGCAFVRLSVLRCSCSRSAASSWAGAELYRRASLTRRRFSSLRERRPPRAPSSLRMSLLPPRRRW